MLPLTTLGSTGIRVSRLTVAGRSFAGPLGPFGEQLEAEDVERAYHELGVRSFVATPWMSGVSEGLRRLVQAGLRDELTIIALAGMPTEGRIRAFVRRAGRALGTDRVDVLLMGWVRNAKTLRPEVWDLLHQLIGEGLTRAVGFSIHDRALARQLANELEPPPGVMMIRYNAAHRGAEDEVFAHLPVPKPGIISYTATRWGELLAPCSGFERPMLASECYRFALTHPRVDTVLTGARNYAELEEDAQGVEAGPLSTERYEEVCRFGDAVRGGVPVHPADFMFPRGG